MSTENQKSNRTSLGLIMSTFLHGSVIALVAVGPAFLPSGYTHHDKQEAAATPVSAEPILVEIESPAVEPQMPIAVEPQLPVPVAAQAPAPAPVIVAAPAPTPVKEKKIAEVKKAKASAMPEKKIVAVDFNKKADSEKPVESNKQLVATEEIPPQEPVAVANDEQEVVALPEENFLEEKLADDKPVEETVAEAAPMVAAAEAVSEPAPATEPVTETAPVAAAQETAPITEAASVETVAAVAPAQTVATETAPASTSAPTSAAPVSQAAPTAQAAPAKVTQTYQGLKQVPGNKPPVYTRDMRLQKEQGAGQLVYFVSKEGGISQMRLTKSTGSTNLDHAAVEAFSQYKFVPGQEGFTVHNFEFSLKGPETIDAGRLRTSMNK